MPIPYLTSTALPYGSRVVTIGSVGYIANNYSVSQSLNVIERQDSLGAPNGAIGIQQGLGNDLLVNSNGDRGKRCRRIYSKDLHRYPVRVTKYLMMSL